VYVPFGEGQREKGWCSLPPEGISDRSAHSTVPRQLPTLLREIATLTSLFAEEEAARVKSEGITPLLLTCNSHIFIKEKSILYWLPKTRFYANNSFSFVDRSNDQYAQERIASSWYFLHEQFVPGGKRSFSSRKTTLLRGPRQGFRLFWKYTSKAPAHQPRIAAETIALIKDMAKNNRLWGAERIRGA
jgi:hypothetical protein